MLWDPENDGDARLKYRQNRVRGELPCLFNVTEDQQRLVAVSQV